MKPRLTADSFAYWDTFAGLVPCRVISITDDNGCPKVKFKLTARHARGPYKYGEEHEDFAFFVPPRAAVVMRGRQYRIRPFDVET